MIESPAPDRAAAAVSTADPPRQAAAPWTSLDVAAAACCLLLGGLLFLIFLVWPDFYLRWVLEPSRREYQAVEIGTFAFGLAATLVLIVASVRYLRALRDRRDPRLGRLSAAVVVMVAVATFFYTAEEVSWGQTYLKWQTPASFKQAADNDETNLHNTRWISVQSLGSVFLLVMFIVLPCAWALRDRLPMPADLEAAIPEWPVAICFIVAFGWSKIKNVHHLVVPDEAAWEDSMLYTGFIEQIGEQKELFFAIGLLWYAIYRVRWLRDVRSRR